MTKTKNKGEKELSDKYVSLIKSLETLSIEIDSMALELAARGPDRESRGKLLDSIHLHHPLFFQAWSREGRPRSKRDIATIVDYEDVVDDLDEDYRKWSEEDDEKDKLISLVYDELLPLQEGGLIRAKKLFGSVLQGTYNHSQFKDYYWKITFPHFAMLVLWYSKIHEAANQWQTFIQQCTFEKQRANVLFLFMEVVNKLGIPGIHFENRHLKMIERAAVIDKELNSLIDSVVPGYSKEVRFIYLDPFDESNSDMGTRKGLERCGSFTSGLYYKTCENCGKTILRSNFTDDGKRRGPEFKYCDNCKMEIKRSKTRARVNNHRAKK